MGLNSVPTFHILLKGLQSWNYYREHFPENSCLLLLVKTTIANIILLHGCASVKRETKMVAELSMYFMFMNFFYSLLLIVCFKLILPSYIGKYILF